MLTTRGRIRKHTRTLFDRQGGECIYCEIPMFLGEDVSELYIRHNQPKQATFDHILVKSKGGTYALDNGVCACEKCNSLRGSLDYNVFVDNFDFLVAEWKIGNRHIRYTNGVLTTITAKKRKVLARVQKKREAKQKWEAEQRTLSARIRRYTKKFGKTVQDLFLKTVYNNA